MGKTPDKTNVMRLLEQAGIPFTPHWYEPAEFSAAEAAERLSLSPDCVFKTLVTTGASGGHYVFVIPALASLDLKKAARCAGEKSVVMLKQKELLPLTGYVHGGCSPVGMKKPFPTFIDETALITDSFCCSAGRVGAQVETGSEALAAYLGAVFADLTEA